MAKSLLDTGYQHDEATRPAGKPHPPLGGTGAVKDVAIVPMEQSGGAAVEMFERLARDPGVSVDNLERLMALWERAEARKAEARFNNAMSAAQAEMRAVSADSYNPSTKSRYASYEALDSAVRPIYTKHGFGLSFDTGESPLVEHVRVICLATHLGGHSRPYHVDMPADGKGAKGGDVMTKTHATGSALSYGQRYLLKMIFNIAIGDGDDDGNAASLKGEKPQSPPGYDTFIQALDSVAGDGLKAYEEAWQRSRSDVKTYCANHDKERWAAIKSKAAAVGKGRR